MSDEYLDRLLSFDPLGAAEDFMVASGRAGVNAANDPRVIAVGTIVGQNHQQAKQEALMARDDTTFSNDLERYVGIVERNGYEMVLREGFTDSRSANNALYVFAHPDGLLLCFDSYYEDSRVNGGKVYYNWKPHADKYPMEITSSLRHGEDGVKVGDHDCREALIYRMDRLREYGDFLPIWQAKSFFWLTHYEDHHRLEGASYEIRSEQYRTLTNERIAKFPEWVREMIGGLM